MIRGPLSLPKFNKQRSFLFGEEIALVYTRSKPRLEAKLDERICETGNYLSAAVGFPRVVPIGPATSMTSAKRIFCGEI